MENRKSLDEIMSEYHSDKASWGHDFCKNYELWFNTPRDENVVLFELGIGGEDKELGGASLKGWSEYFPNSKVYGLDIYDKGKLDSDRIKTFIGSQDDENLLNDMIRQVGSPDIIIDDASHINDLTIKSFQILFPKLKPGGIYAIEDLNCAYRWDFNGYIELKDMNLNTITNYLFSMIHDLNPVKLGNPDYENIPEFKGIESIHFYPDLVIIKKKL